ncbi:hypothetical protein [Paraburkholderia youngii]|uniref:Uncharacterized protein n=1 Tax=Paraburkholderia youngii TaxID=2782701 RepID=A0A7Y6JZF1_9BURK|nr:hypothetical protein [Paraburkholderia youngii]NUY01555.1 hypothetical protein [Paraburkholderia youngii]
MAFALVRFITDDRRIVWPSALRVAHRAGVGHDTAQRALASFDRTGLTVRVEGTGDKGGSLVRRIDIQRLHELYPGNVEWDEFSATGRRNRPTEASRKVAAPSGNFNGTKVAAPSGNLDFGTSTHDDGKLPQMDREVAAFADGSCRKQESKLPQMTPEVAAGSGTRVLGLEGLKQGSGGALIAAQASRVSQAKPRLLVDARSAPGHEADGTPDIAAIAQVMLDEFDACCEAKVRSEAEGGCRLFAERGASVDDMLNAIATAMHKERDGRKPRWVSVRNVLDGLLRTRESVVTAPAHAFSVEVVRAAQRLEAIFVQYLDKPAWSSGVARYAMGEWLCRCVAWHNVDEAVFEASCLDVAKEAESSGKKLTWRSVKVALDARMEARRRNASQQSVEDKRFFDPPGLAPGVYLPGNGTLH